MSLDIALLNCIPLDEEDWHQRATLAPCGDFVRFVSETRFNGNPRDAWNFFRTEAEFIKRKLDIFAARGGAVKLRATVDDIRDAAAHHNDVVLIAHWKSEAILLSDITRPAQLIELLAQEKICRQLSPSTEPDVQVRLHDALNEFIFEPAVPLGAVAIPRRDALDRSMKRREILNQIPILAQGNRLEVWDAMLSAKEFSQLFPSSFDGTTFMVVCTSDVLAETFRRQHCSAVCICSRDPVRAGLAMAKLDAALSLMSTKGIPMWRALQKAGDMIDSIA